MVGETHFSLCFVLTIVSFIILPEEGCFSPSVFNQKKKKSRSNFHFSFFPVFKTNDSALSLVSGCFKSQFQIFVSMPSNYKKEQINLENLDCQSMTYFHNILEY